MLHDLMTDVNIIVNISTLINKLTCKLSLTYLSNIMPVKSFPYLARNLKISKMKMKAQNGH